LDDIQNKKMEGPAIHPGKSKSAAKNYVKDSYCNKQRKIEYLITDGGNNHTGEQDDKLPDRYRTENLILDIDELWDCELMHA
jgi:hypothetical protein